MTAPVVNTPVKTSPFKTKTQITQAKVEDYRKQGKVQNVLGAIYDATDDVQSLKQTVVAADAKASQKLNLKSQEQIFRARQDFVQNKLGNLPIVGSSIKSADAKAEKFVAENKVANAIGSFANDEYNFVRDKPVSAGIEVGKLYAEAYLGGVGFGLAKTGARGILTGAGLAKAAKFVNPVVDTGFEAAIVNSFAKQGLGKSLVLSKTTGLSLASSDKDYEGLIKNAGKLALGIHAFGKGSKLADSTIAKTMPKFYNGAKSTEVNWSPASAAIGKSVTVTKALAKDAKLLAKGNVADIDVVPLVPFVKRASISEITGQDTHIPVKFGHTVDVLGKTVVTHVTGEGSKIHLGKAGAPASALEGKLVQAFTPRETGFFKKTVARNAENAKLEADYLNSALGIAKSVNKTTKPLTTPERFEITSTAIPAEARASITKAIKSYEGEIKVTGSVPMKSQADPYVTRATHDLEIYGDDKVAIAQHIAKQLKADGIKDFSIDAKDGKIDFVIDGKTETGIEIFTHGISDKALETYAKELDAKDVSSPEPSHELAFGYDSRPGIRIGNKKEGYIEVQDLAEQVTRKIAGSTMYHENIVQPQHPGRIKDVGDTITTSVKFALNGKAKASDIITFTNSAFEKFGVSPKETIAGKKLIESDQLTNVERLMDINKKGNKQTTADKAEATAIKTTLNEAGLTTEATTYIRDAKLYNGFIDKVATDPVVKFIHDNQRLPTQSEATQLSTKLISPLSDKQVLFDSNVKEITTGNALVDNAVNKNIFESKTNKENIFKRKTANDNVLADKTAKNENIFKRKVETTKITETVDTGYSDLFGRRTNESMKPTLTRNEKIGGDDIFGRAKTEKSSPTPISRKNGDIFGRSKTEVKSIKPTSTKPIVKDVNTRWNASPIANNSNTGIALRDNTKPYSLKPVAATVSPKSFIIQPTVLRSTNPFSPSPMTTKNFTLFSPSPSPIVNSSSKPSLSPSSSPSIEPSVSPSPSPSIEPNIEPSPSPSPSPVEPSPSPSPSPLPSSSSSPSPSPSESYGSYSGFINYDKRKPGPDETIFEKKKKSAIQLTRQMRIGDQALMISKTKVNTFSEMLGHTGEKDGHGIGENLKTNNYPESIQQESDNVNYEIVDSCSIGSGTGWT